MTTMAVDVPTGTRRRGPSNFVLKHVMAVTGVLFVAFVAVHLFDNLKVPAVDIIPAVWSAECGPYCVIARHPDGPGGTTMRDGTREPPTSTIIGTGYQHDDDA